MSLFISPDPSYLLSDMGPFVLLMTFSPTQSCDVLVTDGPLAYPTRSGVWRDIGVRSGLALIPLVTEPLPSLQKTSLVGCATLPFISSGPSYLSSDVRSFVLLMTHSTYHAMSLIAS